MLYGYSMGDMNIVNLTESGCSGVVIIASQLETVRRELLLFQYSQ